ncbi:MAG: AAA family ATPase [Candidatus Marsarchaeota archaeon]|nr:AAA family ATPase [Candidatus Marsarchaeota archaeon]MCL5412860.1 AAA family ATPase [Candidatus Marsarchaeota archaeon]
MTKRIIVITGTPGVGKTTISERLAKTLKKAELIRANDVVKERKLYISSSKDGALIVRLGGLESELNRMANHSTADYVIIEGHLLCDMRIMHAVAVVMREHPAALLKRLKKRKYGRQKIEDNIVSEAIDYCGVNASRNYGTVYEIEAGSSALRKVVDIARGKKIKANDIEMLGELNGVLDLL